MHLKTIRRFTDNDKAKALVKPASGIDIGYAEPDRHAPTASLTNHLAQQPRPQPAPLQRPSNLNLHQMPRRLSAIELKEAAVHVVHDDDLSAVESIKNALHVLVTRRIDPRRYEMLMDRL